MADIAQAVTATAEVLGHEITPAAVQMITQDLADYPDQQIAQALQACRRELTGRLTLAAILQRITQQDGHPEPNEAWAIALRAADEASSVGITRQIAAALQAANPVLATGDKIGGRMAFIDSYQRQLAQARNQYTPAQWYLSPGHCPQGRAEELERMKQEGLLTSTSYAHQLQQHCQSNQLASPKAGAVVSLIAHKPTQPVLVKQRIQHLQQLLKKAKA